MQSLARAGDLGILRRELRRNLRRPASASKHRRLAAAQKMGDYKVANCPDQSLAFTNCVFISQSDFAVLGDDPVHIELKGKGLPFVYRASPSPKIEPGCVGLNSVQRRLLEVSLNDPIAVAKFDERAAAPLAAVAFGVDYIGAVAKRGVETLDGAAFVAHLLDKFAHQYLATGQLVAFEFNGENYKFTVADLELVDGGGGGEPAVRGLLSAQTQLLPRKAAGAALAFSGLRSRRTRSSARIGTLSRWASAAAQFGAIRPRNSAAQFCCAIRRAILRRRRATRPLRWASAGSTPSFLPSSAARSRVASSRRVWSRSSASST